MSDVLGAAFGAARPVTAPNVQPTASTTLALVDYEPRCVGPHPRIKERTCGHLLANSVTRPWDITCRCTFRNVKT